MKGSAAALVSDSQGFFQYDEPLPIVSKCAIVSSPLLAKRLPLFSLSMHQKDWGELIFPAMSAFPASAQGAKLNIKNTGGRWQGLEPCCFSNAKPFYFKPNNVLTEAVFMV